MAIGMDANCTFPRGMQDLTGECIRDPLKSHTEERYLQVTAWLESMDLWAANTFDPGGKGESWTCGRGRPEDARSSVDYLAVSRDLEGSCAPLRGDIEGMGTADHRPSWRRWTGSSRIRSVSSRSSMA